MFLDEMAKEAKNIITTICDEQCTMSDKVCALKLCNVFECNDKNFDCWGNIKILSLICDFSNCNLAASKTLCHFDFSSGKQKEEGQK